MQRQDVLLICKKVGLEEDVVMKQHQAFIEKYPAGVMTKQGFVDYCLERDETAEETLSETLFQIFDKDSSGSIDFSEYIMASRASKVEPSDKVCDNLKLSSKAENTGGKT